MSSPFVELLAGLNRQRGVVGSLIASEHDGIVVDANVQLGVKAPAVAALAASLYRKARLSTEAAGYGQVGFVQLEAEQGWLCAIGREDLVLAVLAGPKANIGMIRVAMLQAREALA
jgi:predicted regulator of Ras-like GTPase activity (Roadblock/LC7/MglB family)